MKRKQIINRILLPSIGAIVAILPVTTTIAYAHLKTQTYESKNDDSQANSKDLQVQPSSKEEQVKNLTTQLDDLKKKLASIIDKSANHFAEERTNFQQLVSAYNDLKTQSVVGLNDKKITIKALDKDTLSFDGTDIVKKAQDILDAITDFKKNSTIALEDKITDLKSKIKSIQSDTSKLKEEQEANDKKIADENAEIARKESQAKTIKEEQTKKESKQASEINSLEEQLQIYSLQDQYKTTNNTYLVNAFFEIKRHISKNFTAKELGIKLSFQWKLFDLEFELLDQPNKTNTQELRVQPVLVNKVNSQDKICFNKKPINITGFPGSNANELPTIYLDQNQTLQSISGSAPAEVTTVFQMGFNAQKAAYQMPTTIKTVSNYLPPQITSLQYMFQNATAFNQDISNWDVSKVENMRSMFVSAEKFNNGDVAGGSNKPLNWDGKVKNVTDMSFMFGGLKGAKSFNQNISGWDVSKVTKMNSMFQNAKQFSNGNKPLAWNDKVQNVTDMSWMFSQATAFNQDLGSWNVSNVTSMYYMFNSATAFNQDISNWDVSKVENMYSMFVSAEKFNNGDVAGGSNKPLNWDGKVKNVTDMSWMFSQATAFNQDISNWDVSKVENMRSMFVSAEKFNNGDVAGGSNKPLNWDGKVKNVTDMSFMFGGLKGAKSFNQNISGWDVSKVTKMNSMFQNAKQFSNGNKPLAWNDKVQNVTDMSWMFSQATAFNQDLGSWNVSNVTSMYYMFNSATAFNQDISNWDVSKVENMRSMFSNATAFNNNGQSLASWANKLNKVKNMDDMFNNAQSCDLDLSSWKVPLITEMPRGFNTNSGITKLPQWAKNT